MINIQRRLRASQCVLAPLHHHRMTQARQTAACVCKPLNATMKRFHCFEQNKKTCLTPVLIVHLLLHMMMVMMSKCSRWGRQTQQPQTSNCCSRWHSAGGDSNFAREQRTGRLVCVSTNSYCCQVPQMTAVVKLGVSFSYAFQCRRFSSHINRFANL